MGAWGYGPFDNDTAQDWLREVLDDIRIAVDEAQVAVAVAAEPEGGGGFIRISPSGKRRLIKDTRSLAEHHAIPVGLAAIGLLVNLYSGPIDQDYLPDLGLIDKCIDLLDALVDDEQYINSWKSPARIVGELGVMAGMLKKLRTRTHRRIRR